MRRPTMQTEITEIDRREFLIKMLSTGLVGSVVSTVLARQVLAMGVAGQLPQGIQKMQGLVLINGIRAQIGSLVVPGDVITTGSASHAVIVVDKDAYLVRENSAIELMSDMGERHSTERRSVSSIKVKAGKLLSVFGQGARSIETITAVVGVR